MSLQNPIEQGMSTYFARCALRRDESGWALMDAVWSAAIVAMAFLASMTLLDSSTRSADRSAKKSQAMIVAQNELNHMRNVGQRDEDQLRAMNDTTKEVVYRGASFNVKYTATPTSGIGDAPVEVCGVDYDAAGETAALPDDGAFIYMRVDVSYLGEAGGPSGAVANSGVGQATLDSHFAAERSTEVNTDVGMLRVYTLGYDENPVGVNGVTLLAPDNSVKSPAASNATKGCFLFTGLAAGEYSIRVQTAMQDIYMTNNSGTVSVGYQMPTGVLRSTAVQVANPVKVLPTYKYTYGGVEKSLTTATAGVNDFVKAPSGTGNWVAMSDAIYKPPVGNPNFFLTPGGVLMPNASSGDPDKSRMYPVPNGYSGYAGPCVANDPGQANWITVPGTLPNATWTPGGTLSPAPAFWLSTLQPYSSTTPIHTSQPSGPDTGWGATQTYYWGQNISDARVQVALVGDRDGTTTPTQCSPGYSLGSTAAAQWKRVPGVTTGGSLLSDISSALPLGTYDICLRAVINYTQRDYYGGSILFGFGAKWQGSATNGSVVAFLRAPRTTVGYKSSGVTVKGDFSPPHWKERMSASASTSTATCGNSGAWG